jgi:hypothetical protein
MTSGQATKMTNDDQYLFPAEIRSQMLEMHHEEWDKLKAADPVRSVAVEGAVGSLVEAFPDLTIDVLADLFAFIVSSLKGSAERGATLTSVLNGYADICSELTDLHYANLQEVTADGE